MARDGGLYLPTVMPTLGNREIAYFKTLKHAELVTHVMWPFVEGDGMHFQTFEQLILKAFGDQWSHQAIAPVVRLAHNLYVCELFHGPTLAFKDHAMQVLGQVLPYFLQVRKQHTVMATATSGDTGPAAMSAFAGKEGVELFVLFPEGGTSDFQRRQMTTIPEANVHAIAIRGTFDDCQDIVKELRLPTTNSINWLRIAAQLPYYFGAAFNVMRSTGAQRVSFAVPCGNFGNMYAGLMAKRMGLPIDELAVCANQNRMLVDAVKNGVYRQQDVTPTNSPSVDIGKSSNFERLVADLVGDPAEVRRLYEEFKQRGQFTLSEESVRQMYKLGLRACWTGDKVRLKTMREAHQSHDGYQLDPHTANAYPSAKKRSRTKPVVIMGTAAPAKFEGAVFNAIGEMPSIPARFTDMATRPERVVTLDNSLAQVQSYMRDVLSDRKIAWQI